MTDLSPDVHGKVEEEEEEVRHTETGQEETGVVAGRALPPADDREGESDGGVTNDPNLDILNISIFIQYWRGGAFQTKLSIF